MAKDKITLAKLAEQLGVSKMAVSRALKGQLGVSDKLRREVRSLAASLGYKVERLRSREERGNFIFLVPTKFYLASDIFYHEIYFHLNSLCLSKNIELSVRILGKDAESAGILPQGTELAEGVFLGGEMAEPVLREIEALNIPCVAIDFNVMSGRHSSVIIDNYLIGSMAAEYLFTRGYRSIGFIGSYSRASSASDRIHGLLKVVRQKGLPFRDDWIIENFDENIGTYMMDIALPDELPEAFICYNDSAAYYFIEKLKIAGYRAPEDVAILGIDNTSLASSCTPPLTSVNIDRCRYAEIALHLMMEALEGGKPVRREYLNTAIVERDSTPEK